MLKYQGPTITHGFITLHLRRTESKLEKNNYKYLLSYAHNNDCMPSRSFIHKGYSPVHIAKRLLIDSELGKPAPARYIFYRYKDPIGLIGDEWEITNSIEWCQELIRVCNISESLEKILSQYQMNAGQLTLQFP